jgi:hypothetical protein
VVAIIGGILLAISPALPWVTLGRLSMSGLEKTNNEALVLTAFGVLGCLPPLIMLIVRKRRANWGATLCGVVGLGGAAIYFALLSRGARVSLSVGVGIILAFVGSITLIIGSVAAGFIKGTPKAPWGAARPPWPPSQAPAPAPKS